MILLIRRIRGQPRDHIFSDPPTEGLSSQGRSGNFARTGRELRGGGGWRGSPSSTANNPGQADLLRRANHKSPYPPLDRAVAKALRQSRGGLRRRMLQARRVARLDFTPQRCSLTVSDGDIARRRRFTFLI